MNFVWYWTFWHWSKESYRSGALLRSPLHGVGSHWDEWFRHEASAGELRAVEQAGRSESSQRRFIAWLYKSWSREMEWRENRMVTRFVLSQLAQVRPFNQWVAFEKYRADRYPDGISAIVLAEGSSGEVTDVRKVEALALPTDPSTSGNKVLIENFRADREDLETPRSAAESLLCGKGLLIFLGLWIATGKRPYPVWLKIALFAGWLTTGFLILYLLLGNDPEDHLAQMIATLTGLWSVLALTALFTIATQAFHAWRAGKEWSDHLKQSQVRLHMAGGLTLNGSSAGLPFCLNTLQAAFCAWPRTAHKSWIWRRFFHYLHGESGSWAATGVVTRSGFLKAVVLDQKIRACSSHADIRHVLIPRQRNSGGSAFRDVTKEPAVAKRPETPALSTKIQLGYAAEKPPLHIHACRHVAQSLLAIGNFSSRWQLAANAFAILVSITLLTAAPDIRAILFPFPAPVVVSPASPSPNFLWVSLDTTHPRYFEVELESPFWANRVEEVSVYNGANASVRAEIPLRRLSQENSATASDGIVWVKRRQCFLTRQFLTSERVGRYTLPYLTTLGYK